MNLRRCTCYLVETMDIRRWQGLRASRPPLEGTSAASATLPERFDDGAYDALGPATVLMPSGHAPTQRAASGSVQR